MAISRMCCSRNIFFLVVLFSLISRQAIAQDDNISLLDIGWSIESNNQIKGKYELVNNLNKKVTITKIWVHRNSTHEVNPYVSGFRDSIILQPLERKSYTYSTYMMNMYFNDFNFFFGSFKLPDDDPRRPHIKLYISYFLEEDSSDEKSNIECLFLEINKLTENSSYFDTLIIHNMNMISMEMIKNHPCLKFANAIDCDSVTGTALKERVCANLELQRQDSLLRGELDAVIGECKTMGDTVRLQQILLAQELWERYRFAHCASCFLLENRADMISFMRCVTELTMMRRNDVNKLGEH